jgi:hypothetical protein
LIDNEIFLLWLNENKDIIQNAYRKYKYKYEQICALQQTSDDTCLRKSIFIDSQERQDMLRVEQAIEH